MSNQTTIIALKNDRPGFNLLSQAAVDQWSGLMSFLAEAYRNSSEESRRRLDKVDGCLDKLNSSLQQISRLRNFHDSLLQEAKRVGATVPLLAFRGDLACADFEGFLLQGRSALDRLTWFVAYEFKNKCSSFRELKNILNNFTNKSQEAANLVSIIDDVSPWFDGLLGQLESPESLRDLVGHKHALTEGVQNCFTIAFLRTSDAILFDCEISLPDQSNPVAIFRTALEAVQYLVFTVINSLSILLKRPTLSLERYLSTWENKAVVFREYVLDELDGTPLGPNTLTVVKRMTLDGFETTTRNMKKELFTRGVPL